MSLTALYAMYCLSHIYDYTYRPARNTCILFVYFEIETEKKQTKNTRAVANYRWSRVCVNPHRMLEIAMRACPAGVCASVCVNHSTFSNVAYSNGNGTSSQHNEHEKIFPLVLIDWNCVCFSRAHTSAPRTVVSVCGRHWWLNTSLVVLFFFSFSSHM